MSDTTSQEQGGTEDDVSTVAAPDQDETADTEGHLRMLAAPDETPQDLTTPAAPGSDEDDTEGHIKMRG